MKRNAMVTAIIVVVAILSFLIGQSTRKEQPQTENVQIGKKVTVTFPGAEKHEISLADAKIFIQNQRKSLQVQKLKTAELQGESFGRAAIDKILAQPGCNALRIYYGRDNKGNPNLVLLGVDTASADMTNGMIMERGLGCPPFCDVQSALMSQE
jgi:hypothetical protein